MGRVKGFAKKEEFDEIQKSYAHEGRKEKSQEGD